jgi:GntR family transcriptional regulator
MQQLRESRRPLHVQVEAYLTDLVGSEAYDVGEQLPSEVEMAARIGVSRSTLREALRSLEQKGLIVRKHGVGTFVAPGYDRRLESGLERLESVLTLACEDELEITIEDLDVHQQPASPDIAEKLEMAERSPLTIVRRVLAVEEGPFAYMIDSIPSAILAPDDVGVAFAGSVLDLLLADPGLEVDQALANIVPLVATPFLSRKLDVDSGEPLLLLEETLFDRAGVAVEYSRNYFVPEFFRFSVVRRRVRYEAPRSNRITSAK